MEVRARARIVCNTRLRLNNVYPYLADDTGNWWGWEGFCVSRLLFLSSCVLPLYLIHVPCPLPPVCQRHASVCDIPQRFIRMICRPPCCRRYLRLAALDKTKRATNAAGATAGYAGGVDSWNSREQGGQENLEDREEAHPIDAPEVDLR